MSKLPNLQLCALDVVPLLNLFVLRVRAVVCAAHGEEEDVLARRLLQGQGHRDGAAWKRRLNGKIGRVYIV